MKGLLSGLIALGLLLPLGARGWALTWITRTVDRIGDVGEGTSLALDRSRYAHISYYDVGKYDLKYAVGVPEPSTFFLLCAGAVGLLPCS